MTTGDEVASPRRPRPRTVLLAVAFVALVITVVLLARWLRSTDPVSDFLLRYPGSYPLPEGSPIGTPAWLAWQHFLNAFFLVLIVRTGLQSRRERSPAALWTSRRNRRRRMSLTVWFHLAVDVLWLVNGVAFVVLLFVTGQWVRIVPTSWEVFPNAVSTALQFASLDWPTEGGWAGYNSLQQLSYFLVVFLAAPLAAVSGARMSAFWPRDAARLNKLYSFEAAKRLHLPVMVFFVLFVIVHVGLVLSTGVLRNLNNMFAARDAADAAGLVVFIVSLLVMAAGWVFTGPRVVAWIARHFGEVTVRSR